MPTDHTHPSQFTQSKKHIFDVDDAIRYGFVESLLITFFSNRLSWYREKGLHQHGGKTWMRISQKELKQQYPYFTANQVRRATENLIEQGVLETAVFNNTAYDRTLWYSLSQNKPMEISEPLPSNCQECDLPFAKSDKCIDIVYNNTMYKKAAAVEKPQTLEPSDAEYRAAAAASLKKTRPEIKVYPCLEALDISPTEKQHLTRRFSQALVEEAIAWATSPGVVIKRSLIAALKWYCTLSPAERPKPRENPEALKEKQKRIDQEAEELVEKHKRLVKEVDGIIQSPHSSFIVYPDEVIFSPFGTGQSAYIRYDNKNFIDLVGQEMIKRGFERIT